MTNYLISQDDRNDDDSGKDNSVVILSSINTRGMGLIIDKTSLEVMIVDKTSLGVMIVDKNLSRSDDVG